jgi:acyl phosphate:glycerol-3-phosphate acyltransferase
MHVALGATLAFLAGYLVGSAPLGLLVAKAVSGIDIRRYGTGGVGASNVRQNVGTLWAAIVMLGLFAQGLLPPLAVRLADAPEATVVAAALGAVVGYSWSVFLGFKVEGARGVGISTGAAAALCPSGLLPLYSACALGALLRQGSVGVLVGFVLYAGWAVYFVDSVAYAVGAFALLALVVVRRLEGVREDLRTGALLPVVVDRLLFDRRPGRRLAGSAEEGRP